MNKKTECELCDLAYYCEVADAPPAVLYPTTIGNCKYYTPKSCPEERRDVLKERMKAHENK